MCQEFSAVQGWTSLLNFLIGHLLSGKGKGRNAVALLHSKMMREALDKHGNIAVSLVPIAPDGVKSHLPRQTKKEAIHQCANMAVPLVPIVPAMACVEFIPEVALVQKSGKFPVGWEQAFLIAAGEKKVRHFPRIGRPCQNKRIIFLLMLALPGTKNRSMVPPLANPLGREWTSGNVK